MRGRIIKNLEKLAIKMQLHKNYIGEKDIGKIKLKEIFAFANETLELNLDEKNIDYLLGNYIMRAKKRNNLGR